MYLYQHLLTSARNYLMCICSLWPSSRTRLLHVLIEAWFYLVLSIVHLFYRARRSEGKYTIRKQVIYIISIKLLTPFKLPIFMRYGTLIYIYWQGHFLFISFFFWTNKWTWIYIKQVCPVNSVWTTYCKWLYKSLLFLYIMWPHMGFELASLLNYWNLFLLFCLFYKFYRENNKVDRTWFESIKVFQFY